MEPRDNEEQGGRQETDSPPGGEAATGSRSPAEGAQVIGTDHPGITRGPLDQPDWVSDPDRAMSIETSQIRGPNEAFDPHFVIVPVEPARPPDRSGAGNGGKNKNETGKKNDQKDQKGRDQDARNDQSKSKDEDEDEHKDEPKKSGDSNKEKDKDKEKEKEKGPQHPWYHPSSLMHGMLMPAVVALVCGIVGAWGYSYFFGSSKSDDKSSSSKDSGSGKDKDKGKDSDSGQDSDSDKNADSSKKGVDPGKLLEAQSAWMDAVKELREARATEKEARRSEDQLKAILDFFKNKLLLAGRSGDMTFEQIYLSDRPAKNLTMRQAIDAAESRISETFADRPLAEATVREMLGLANLNLGDPAKAVTQFERAFALRQAMQGDNNPETADCRNRLAVAYRLAGRTTEAGQLFDHDPHSRARITALAVQGSMLLLQKKSAEAELKLRECLTIREKTEPDDWATYDTKSMLGEALLDQHKFADAEPLLIAGYEGMKQHEAEIPAPDKPRLARARERLVNLYDAWGKKDEALRWRTDQEMATKRLAGPG